MKNIIGMLFFAMGAYIMALSMNWITDHQSRLVIVEQFSKIYEALEDYRK